VVGQSRNVVVLRIRHGFASWVGAVVEGQGISGTDRARFGEAVMDRFFRLCLVRARRDGSSNGSLGMTRRDKMGQASVSQGEADMAN